MIRRALAVPALLALTACGASEDTADRQADDAFFAALSELCGNAYEGEATDNRPEPEAGTDPFEENRLVMHVRGCTADEIRIPLHVGEDRSRTWVITRTEDGLRLKHDHRHEDGAPDAVTMYGGDSADATAERVEFPADDESKTLFQREGLAVSTQNTWALEIDPGDAFVYELSRPGRFFRAEFDLTRPVTAPPPPWGAED
nr:hypothetical protein [Euryhalocaulis caribicus]